MYEAAAKVLSAAQSIRREVGLANVGGARGDLPGATVPAIS